MSRARPGVVATVGLADPDPSRQRSGAALRDLMAPLDHLLISGGDSRLTINPATGCNDYGCQPQPAPSLISFSSSTATSISPRAYDRATVARESLMQSAITSGFDDAFEARIEAMRDDLKRHLGLSETGAEVIFSASGTDSQLHALFLTRSLLGAPLTSVVVAGDQTGSGTVHTARGRHFNDITASRCCVRKGEPIDGLAESVASLVLPLLQDDDDIAASVDDARVIGTVADAIANGTKVLLQVMDGSKLGRRVPSDQCLQTIQTRWPDDVQVVVDACQMRLGRRRLRAYLDRGFMVLITGSKFFGGPPFSGALLVPAALSDAIGAADRMPHGLRDYGTRSDWPWRWRMLRSHFSPHANLGQWLRWEAALEEIRAYFYVPGAFRRMAVQRLATGIAAIVNASPSLRLLSPQRDQGGSSIKDEDLEMTTIFPFTIEPAGRKLSLNECKEIYQKLKAQDCLVGQPVGWTARNGRPVAALRISIGARQVTDAWSIDEALAERNLQGELDRVSVVAANIEALLGS